MTKIEARQTGEGIIQTITSPDGLQYISQTDYRGQSLLALEVYDATGDFDVEYILFKNDLQTEHIKHAGQQHPSFIKDPRGDIFVSIEYQTGGKGQELVSRLFPKNEMGNGSVVKSFGDGLLGFIGNTGYYLSRCKLKRVDFEDGKITVHRNKAYKTFTKGALNKNYIHTLCEYPERVLIHEQLDRDCKAIFSREIEVPGFDYFEVLNLAIDSTSRIVAFRPESKDVEIWTIDEYGNLGVQILFSVESEIYTLFPPVSLHSGAVLFHFIAEDQYGWFLVKDGALLECFLERSGGYQSLLDDRFIRLGPEEWVLAGANATTGNGYSLTFYPAIEKFESAVDKIILLNRAHD
jgi:hypothetical protein